MANNIWGNVGASQPNSTDAYGGVTSHTATTTNPGDPWSAAFGSGGFNPLDPMGVFKSSQSQYTPGPPPAMPTLANSIGADGNIKLQYKLKPQALQQYDDNGVGAASKVNLDPLHQLESYASGTGDSPWAKLALQQNQNALQNQLGSAADNNQSGMQNAISDLAASGGATEGARERIATQGSKNLLDSTQNARSAAQQNALGIQGQDAQQRMAAMEMLPGQEVASVQPGLAGAEFGQQQKQNLGQMNQNYLTGINQANITNALGGLQNANQNALNIYGQQMQGYAANNTAEAIQNAPSGKKGGHGGGKK